VSTPDTPSPLDWRDQPIERAFAFLIDQGLTLQSISRLVGCSYVTLYRARNGKTVHPSTLYRVSALRVCCIDEETALLLQTLASTYPAEKIWQVGLAQIIEENRQ